MRTPNVRAAPAPRSFASPRPTTTATTTGPTERTAQPIPKAIGGGSCNACATRPMSNNVDRTLAALADPTRREVIDLLRKKPRKASDIADALSMSRPAMSRHLRTLRKTGLVAKDEVDTDARVRVYRLNQAPFTELRGWLDEVEAFWSVQLASFKQRAERRRREPK